MRRLRQVGGTAPPLRRPSSSPWVVAESAALEYAASMADPQLSLHCPYCGELLVFVRTKRDTRFYRCSRHGYLILPRDGRLRSASREDDYDP